MAASARVSADLSAFFYFFNEQIAFPGVPSFFSSPERDRSGFLVHFFFCLELELFWCHDALDSSGIVFVLGEGRHCGHTKADAGSPACAGKMLHF